MIQKVQIEPDRKGWARLADMYYKYDEDKIRDAKEDIDTLLVFVRISYSRFILCLICLSLGWFILSSPFCICHRDVLQTL